jgi:hypothetical protein
MSKHATHSEEDESSAEKSVVRQEPTAADYEPAVNVFRSVAALGVIYGTAGVIAVPLGLLRFHQGAIAGDFRVALVDGPIRSMSAEAVWLLCSSLCGTGLAVAVMVGGIGAMQLKSWSYVVLRLWALGSVVFGIIGSLFFVQWLFSPGREVFSEARGVDDVLVNFLGWGIGTVLAIGMLVVIRRPGVRDALRRGGKIALP